MPELMASPPKRMTRARAAAKKTAAAADEGPKARATKAKPATTAPTGKATATTAASTRRKAAQPAPEQPEDVKTEPGAKAPAKKRATAKAATSDAGEAKKGKSIATRGGTTRGRKAAVLEEENDDVDMAETESSKTRGKSRTAAAAATAKNPVVQDAPAKTTRSRGKKGVEEAPAEEAITIERPMRTRNTATGPTASTRSRAAASGVAKAAPKKKKVTFMDVESQDDKENATIDVGAKKNKQTETGLKAKPVRKPTTTRGRKPATRAKAGQEDESKPLSPKKVTQIAKSTSSVSSDDELSGAKTPMKALSKSPVKPSNDIFGSVKGSATARKLDFGSTNDSHSPTKSEAVPSEMLLASPARHMPPSPFKDAMKESPKRGTTLLDPFVGPSFRPSTPSRETLRESPKRGAILPESLKKSSLKPANSPFKASLLQSPARRPTSPQKWAAELGSPSKVASSGLKSPTKVGSKTLGCSPTRSELENGDQVINAHFRASPERPVQAYTLTEDDIADEAGLAQESSSPMKGVIMTPKPHVDTINEAAVDEAVVSGEEPAVGDDTVDLLSTVKEPVSPSPNPKKAGIDLDETVIALKDVFVSPASAGESSAWKRRNEEEEEESEDELQSDATPISRFPIPTTDNRKSILGQRNRLSDVSTPAANLAQHPQGHGMTPLAVQLSGWFASRFASSPSKPDPKQPTRSIFSPAAAVAAPQPQAKSRLSTVSSVKETPPKNSFFEDEMAAREFEKETSEWEESEDQERFNPVAQAAAMGPEEFEEDQEQRLPTYPSPVIEPVVSEGQEMSNDECLSIEPTAPLEDQDDIECHVPVFEPCASEKCRENFTDQLSDVGSEVQEGDSEEEMILLDATQCIEDVESGEHQNPVLLNTAEDVEAQVCQEHEEMVFQRISVAVESPVSEHPEDSILLDDTASTETSAPGNRADIILEDESPDIEPNVPLTHPASQISQDSETYGDENEPMETNFLLPLQRPNPVAVPFATPQRLERPAPRVMHTVSKVPLKPMGEDSPIKVPRKRSRSVSGGSSPRKSGPISNMTRSIRANSESRDRNSHADEAIVENDNENTLEEGTCRVFGIEADSSPMASPLKSPYRPSASSVLQGAVVYVDVHTTDGADASGIFIDLLTQMGARCVKNWTWNPRASISLPRDATFDFHAAIEEARESSTPAGAKVGITHVVFKDGGKRTLEKVRDSRGVVLCVGVGWVLDCEKENKWLDESDYTVDLSMISRQGSRRRKSMEPKALSNVNGNLVPAKFSPTTTTTPLVSPEQQELQEKYQESPPPSTPIRPETYPLPETPSLAAASSPTTPYYLSQGAKLVQQTCPPKQTGEGLFRVPMNKDELGGERNNSNNMARRLLVQKRKSLQWAPKVRSPLGRP